MFAINRLHVKANQKDAQAVVSDLQYGSWSVIDNQQWLFIRSLSVRGKRGNLRQQASEETKKAIQQAVDGRLANAASANAIHFQSLPELLAFLLRDLANGKAPSLWYWQRWQYLFSETPSQAVQRLLWKNCEHLAAVVQHLVHYDYLPDVWPLLSRSASAAILKNIVHDASVLEQKIFSQETDHSDPTDTIIKSIENILLNQYSVLSSWRQVLSTINEIDKRDERCQLAAVAMGLQYCPLLTQRHPTTLVQVFCRLLRATTEKQQIKRPADLNPGQHLEWSFSHTKNIGKKDGKKNHSLTDVDSPQGLIEPSKLETQQGITARKNRNADLKQNIDKTLRMLSDHSYESVNTDQKIRTAERLVYDSPKRFKNDGRPDTTETSSEVLRPHFITQYSGIFYLINAIRDEACQRLLFDDPNAGISSGWLWLYQLAKHLVSDVDTSLLHFIAEQCGLDPPRKLVAISQLPAILKIYQLLEARFAQTTVWNQGLIEIPGQVVTTASHIDVYFPLSSVNLDVRLAGLDVNPGWVPWLGRVITFHYQQDETS